MLNGDRTARKKRPSQCEPTTDTWEPSSSHLSLHGLLTRPWENVFIAHSFAFSRQQDKASYQEKYYWIFQIAVFIGTILLAWPEGLSQHPSGSYKMWVYDI